MATSSFEDVSTLSWQPSSVYQEILSTIQGEVEQGLWTNEERIDGWCCIEVSPPQGQNESWVIYTYQLIADTTQQMTVIWPAGWSAPAENINGQLPCHFFSGGSSSTTEVAIINPEVAFYKANAAPGTQPTYKLAGSCT